MRSCFINLDYQPLKEMLLIEDLIVNIFVLVDDFCNKTIPIWNEYLKDCNDNNSNGKKIYRHRKDTLSESEIMTILLLYQLSQYKNFKKYYNRDI